MERRSRAVQTESQPPEARLFEANKRIPVQQRRCAMRHGRMKALVGGIFHQLIDIRALERISPGKDKDWGRELRDVIHEFLALGCAELE